MQSQDPQIPEAITVSPAGPVKLKSRGPLLRLLFYIRDRRGRACEGLALGSLFGLCSAALGLNDLLHADVLQDILVAPALAGMALALSPARRLLHVAVCLNLVALLVVGYTPITSVLLPSLMRTDPLERASAVVILSSSLHKDNTLDAPGQQRALLGFLLMKQGWAGTLVLTRAIPSIGDQSTVIAAQMHTFGLYVPIESVGPVTDSHDEAMLVADLARSRGWKRIILVTQPWHMRRAHALFLKQGLQVICAPCAESRYDITDLDAPRGRLSAFRDWLHETLGYQVYRLHNWL